MMDYTDADDPFREVMNEVTRISCLFEEDVLNAIDKLNAFNNINNFENDMKLILKTFEKNISGGQGTVFQSHTEYFKKDRESRHTYNKYPLNKSYAKYARKTIKATKPPIKRHGWKGKR